MSNPLGARKDARYKAVSSAPSINRTGPNKVPVAYPVIADLSNSVGTSPNVFYNGKPAYHLRSSQPNCKGDSAGTGGGVKSDTVGGEVKPTSASSTVFINGQGAVAVGHSCSMQGGNCIGVIVAQPEPTGKIQGGKATQATSPPVAIETPQEKGKVRQWLDRKAHQIKEALKNPVDGLIGAGKGIANLPSNILETIGKGMMSQQAAKMKNSAYLLEAMGSPLAGGMHGTSKSIQQGAADLTVPKLELANDAQAGGDTIATILMCSGGLAKVAVKGLRRGGGKGAAGAKGAKPPKANAAGEDAGKSLAAEDSIKAGAETEKAGEGASAVKNVDGSGDGISIARPAAKSESIIFHPKQLQAKFKHAGDFGVSRNYSQEGALEFEKALKSHVDSTSTLAINGAYNKIQVTHYYNPNTRLNVMVNNSGEFVSGWKLNPAQIKHLTTTGKIGGH